ncbi:MAG: biotin attachment protein [Candidatus Rokubacteria bacterium]|nr:biotin attachment protein [Candidatus Rokubacteria bacterium]
MHEIRIPKLGMDTLECDVKAWLVKVGDRVSPGAPLLEVETEKADVVIEAEVAGVVVEIKVPAGQTTPVGSVVGLIDDAA